MHIKNMEGSLRQKRGGDRMDTTNRSITRLKKSKENLRN